MMVIGFWYNNSTKYPSELWNNLDKYFGVQEEEDEAWSEPNISSCSLSQYVLASTFSDEVIYDEEVSHLFHVVATLFDSNASSFNQEANMEEPSFFVSLEGDFSFVILMMKKNIWRFY